MPRLWDDVTLWRRIFRLLNIDDPSGIPPDTNSDYCNQLSSAFRNVFRHTIRPCRKAPNHMQKIHFPYSPEGIRWPPLERRRRRMEREAKRETYRSSYDQYKFHHGE